jgi:hypothetical protein
MSELPGICITQETFKTELKGYCGVSVKMSLRKSFRDGVIVQGIGAEA